MLDIRKKNSHFHLNGGWLDTRWHFSFGEYYDPQNLHFGPLRVFNDDVIEGESGFPMHPHQEMEIVTLVQGGELTHYDSVGNHGAIRPGDVQKMSAGTGIRHSEWNYGAEPVTLQQIWFLPGKHGLRPSYAQERYSLTDSGLTVVASPWGVAGGVPIYQDVVMALAEHADGAAFELELPEGRGAYLYAIDGENVVDGEELRQGDAIRAVAAPKLTLSGKGRLLVIDLPVSANAQRSALLRRTEAAASVA